MRKSAQPISINRRFGSLVVKRILDDGMIFCVCLPEGRQCGRIRTATRTQLTSNSVKTCQACARTNRSRQHRPPMPPERVEVVTVEVPVCTPRCTVRMDRGVVYVGHDPDCKVLNLFGAIIPKGGDRNVYPATA